MLLLTSYLEYHGCYSEDMTILSVTHVCYAKMTAPVILSNIFENFIGDESCLISTSWGLSFKKLYIPTHLCNNILHMVLLVWNLPGAPDGWPKSISVPVTLILRFTLSTLLNTIVYTVMKVPAHKTWNGSFTKGALSDSIAFLEKFYHYIWIKNYWTLEQL